MHIAQALQSTAWGELDETSFERGVGGREGALIRLSREWASEGHFVTNFVSTQNPKRINVGSGYYEFVPFKLVKACLASFDYDAVVAWECPSIYSDDRILDKQKVRLIEMQCAHFPLFEQEAANEFSTGIVGLSQWHVDFLEHSGVKGPFYVLSNGVDLEHYPTPGDPEKRRMGPKNFFYSSSPDRGLIHLLRLWPKIKNKWPDANLKVAYGASRWIDMNKWSHEKVGEMATDLSVLMKQKDVEDIGIISQTKLAEIQRNSVAWAYPCNTIAPTETGCITAIEAMAAGCPVVTTDCDCLGEEFSEVSAIVKLPMIEDDFFTGLEVVLEDKGLYAALAGLGREFAEKRQWKGIAPKWLELFQEQNSL